MSNFTMAATEKGFAVFIQGVGLVGRTKSVELFKMARKFESALFGELESEIEIDVGREKMESSMVLYDINEIILDSAVNREIGGVSYTVKGSLKAENSTQEIPIRFDAKGRWKEFDFGSLESGKVSDKKYLIVLDAAKLTIDGKVKFDIDTLNNIEIINGVDMLAARRANLGLGG